MEGIDGEENNEGQVDISGGEANRFIQTAKSSGHLGKGIDGSETNGQEEDISGDESNRFIQTAKSSGHLGKENNQDLDGGRSSGHRDHLQVKKFFSKRKVLTPNNA